MFFVSLQCRYLLSTENYMSLFSSFHYYSNYSFILWQMLPKLLITLHPTSSLPSIFSAICWPPLPIKLTKVNVIGIPIITSEIGKGISCLKTLAINSPIDDAETAVKLSVTLLGYILICNGTRYVFDVNVYGTSLSVNFCNKCSRTYFYYYFM